jgi:hypothetical protein
MIFPLSLHSLCWHSGGLMIPCPRLCMVQYVTVGVREYLFVLIILYRSNHFYGNYDKRHYVTIKVEMVGGGILELVAT